MPSWKKIATAAAALFTLFALFVALAVPGIIRSLAEKKVQALTGRKLSINRVSINPLNLRVSIEGLKMQEPGSSVTFVSFSSASARLSPASIWRRAPIVTGIHLVSPYVRITRTAANQYNFSDIPEKLPKSEKKSSSPSYFSLNNITISGGSIDFDDRAARNPKLHTIRQMNVAVPFISNIPYLADKYVQPRFTAVINGAPLDLKGRLKPFQRGMETLLDVNLTDLDIPFYAAYLPAQLPVTVGAGKFSSKIAVSYRVTPDKKPAIAISGQAAVVRLALAEKNGSELFGFDRFALKINQADLMGGSYDIASISLDAPLVTVVRTADGRWPHQRLMPSAVPPKDKKEEKAEKKETPSVRIGEVRLNGGRVRVDDRLPTGGFRTEVRQLTALVSGLATKGTDAADYEISFSTTKGEHLELAGDLALEPMEGSASLSVSGIPLEAYYPYLADRLTAPVGGKGELTAEASWSKEDGVVIDDLGIKLKDLSIRYGHDDSARIAEAVLTGGTLDLKKKSAAIGSVSVRQAKVTVTKDSAGTLSLMSLMRQSQKAETVTTAKGAADKPSDPFHYTVASISGKAIDVTFRDESRGAKPRFDLKGIDIAVSGVTDVLRAPIPVRFNAAYGSRAKLAAKGKITREPFRYSGTLQVNNLPITDFSPYFPKDLNIYLADGNLDLAATVDIAKGQQLTGSFAGNAGLRNLYALDTVETDDLLKWESLQVEDVKGTLEPLVVNVGGISLNRFLARLVVDRQGMINLKKIRSIPAVQPVVAGKASVSGVAAPVPFASGVNREQKRPEIRIDNVTLQDGTVSFLDQHTPKQYGTTMYNLGGRVSGLSSEDFRYADLDLRGELDHHSPLRITGKINPLSRELFADLKVRFTDIELSPVTPYAGTYLGYEIDKGKLFLDLTYKIEKKALQAENKVFIDQFTFGKGVESDKATKLPVRLAIALLKDQHGEIHLDLPVAGRTDDPEFSIFGVVLTVLKNLLVKAATAPFALLQSAFGGGEDLSTVNFASGSPYLTIEEKNKVVKLAGALEKRPEVKLEMSAFVDREKDAEGYRKELLSRKMKGEKFAALVKERKNASGDTPENMEILPAEHDRYLEAVYGKEKFPKPRNAFGFVKDIPAPEMEKLILANTVIGDPQLQSLSRERLAAVRAALISEGKLPAERIFEKRGDMFQLPKKDGQPASRVEFGINVQ